VRRRCVRSGRSAGRGPRLRNAALHDTLTATEAACVLAAARGDRLEGVAVLALRLGLRKGELLGLRWGDVDLDNRTVRVTGTLKRHPGGGLFVD
jgi:integrase